MVLTEWIVLPGAVARIDGRNTATPHQVSVIGGDGQVLAPLVELEVREKRRSPVVIELP